MQYVPDNPGIALRPKTISYTCRRCGAKSAPGQLCQACDVAVNVYYAGFIFAKKGPQPRERSWL